MRFLSTLSIAALAVALAQPALAQGPCCAITSIDARTGLVSAKVNASSQTFQFKVADARIAGTLRVGQAVYANFGTNQVSLDGRRPCCAIAQAPRGGLAVRVRGAVKGQPSPGDRTVTAAVNLKAFTLPEVTYGEPIPAPKNQAGKTRARVESQRITARVAGEEGNADVLVVRGPEGSEKGTGVNEDAREGLKMAGRTPRPGESESYIANARAAGDRTKA